MQAKAKPIIARHKFIKGTVANSFNMLTWGESDINFSGSLPDNVTPYIINYGKKEVYFVETPADLNLQGQPFMYYLQYKHAKRLIVTSYDEWFKWMKSQPVPEKPIFVCGIGRSGTTLMNRAFHQLPQTSVFDEPDIFMQAVRFSNEERIPFIRGTSAALNRDGYRLVMKQRSFVSYMMDSILDAYPDAKIIYMYRNPYDWIVSNMRLFLRTPAPAGIAHELIRMAFKRFLPALDVDEFRPLQMVEAGALLWLKFNEYYADLIAKGYPILGVRYEDLVAEPHSVVSQIFDYCELPQSDVDLALDAFERNSQSDTIFSRQKLGDVELNSRQIGLIKGMLDRHKWLNDPDIRLPGSVVPEKRVLAKV